MTVGLPDSVREAAGDGEGGALRLTLGLPLGDVDTDPDSPTEGESVAEALPETLGEGVPEDDLVGDRDDDGVRVAERAVGGIDTIAVGVSAGVAETVDETESDGDVEPLAVAHADAERDGEGVADADRDSRALALVVSEARGLLLTDALAECERVPAALAVRLTDPHAVTEADRVTPLHVDDADTLVDADAETEGDSVPTVEPVGEGAPE